MWYQFKSMNLLSHCVRVIVQYVMKVNDGCPRRRKKRI